MMVFWKKDTKPSTEFQSEGIWARSHDKQCSFYFWLSVFFQRMRTCPIAKGQTVTLHGRCLDAAVSSSRMCTCVPAMSSGLGLPR